MKHYLVKLVRLLIAINRYVMKLFINIEQKLDVGFDSQKHNKNVIKSTQRHNMAEDKDEVYYAKQYWQHIDKALRTWQPTAEGCYLDLGCGQGRLSLPLASWCVGVNATVDAVDLSHYAIQAAEKRAEGANIGNIKFHTANIHEYLSKQHAPVDGILFTEVAFFLPNLPALLEKAISLLKPGGFFIASFRSQYYNALTTLQSGMWNSIDMLLDERQGRLWNSDTTFNWHTSKEIRNLMDNLGLKLLDLKGIGCCSGIAGDPHAMLAQPSKLNDTMKNQLMTLELGLADDIPDAGRYMLAIATKPKD